MLQHTSTTTARTYGFRDSDGFGWAQVTVNDATGELSIQSDWGTWAYRWNTAHLGAPTLTDFLRDRTGVDYLWRKLQIEAGGGREGRFSARATVVALRLWWLENHEYDDLWRADASGQRIRQLWDDLGVLMNDCLSREELHAYLPIDIYELISNEPYEHYVYEERAESRVLRELILPAFIEALNPPKEATDARG